MGDLILQRNFSELIKEIARVGFDDRTIKPILSKHGFITEHAEDVLLTREAINTVTRRCAMRTIYAQERALEVLIENLESDDEKVKHSASCAMLALGKRLNLNESEGASEGSLEAMVIANDSTN